MGYSRFLPYISQEAHHSSSRITIAPVNKLVALLETLVALASIAAQ